MKKTVRTIIIVSIILMILFPNLVINFRDFAINSQYADNIIIVEILVFGILHFCSSYKDMKKFFINEDQKRLKLKKQKGKLKGIRSVEYVRDLPCNGDIIRLYWIIYQYDLFEEESDLIGAIILKWLKEGKVELIEKNSILFKDEDNSDDLDDETKLMNMLKKAAGENNILEINELKNWAKKHRTEITRWLFELVAVQSFALEKEGLIFKENGERIISSKLDEEANQVLGFKRFLLDYSIIHERYPVEVSLWEEYLIFAQVIGIAQRVKKELKNIYPNSKEIQKNDIICKMPGARFIRIVTCASSLFWGILYSMLFNIILNILYSIASIIVRK